MSEAVAFRVESEEEAWGLLEKALAGDLPEGFVPAVDFKGWPHVEVYLPDAPNASISPSMMRALIELQDSVYRAHAAVTAGKAKVRALSKSERERLEFRVNVRGGSSKYDIDLTKISETLGNAVIGKMTGQELMITIIALATIFGAAVVLRAYLKHKTDTKQQEIMASGHDRVLHAFEALAEQDTKRLSLLTEAVTRVPQLAEARRVADEARMDLLKAVAEEDGDAVVSGVLIPRDAANDLTRNVRKRADEVHIKGVYRVARVDTTVPNGFRVTLRDVTTQDEISASLQDALISEEHRKKIREAEWEKKPVAVELVAKKRRGGIGDAVILDVTDPPKVRGVIGAS